LGAPGRESIARFAILKGGEGVVGEAFGLVPRAASASFVAGGTLTWMRLSSSLLSLALLSGAPLAGPEASQQTIDRYIGIYSRGDPSGAVHPMAVHPAQPGIVAQCDTTGDGFVSVEEARACYEEHFGTISGGMDHVTLEQFQLGLPEAEDHQALWDEIPRAQPDVMTRDEWLAWRERGFAEAAPEGRMPADDYAGWHLGAAPGAAAPQ
jgi:hypothetical protein